MWSRGVPECPERIELRENLESEMIRSEVESRCGRKDRKEPLQSVRGHNRGTIKKTETNFTIKGSKVYRTRGCR